MLDYIKGILTRSSPEKATIEVGGLGYLLLITLATFEKLPQTGKNLQLFISTVIREDSHKMYGFFSQRERDFFEKLIDISGIGPRVGLSILGHLSIDELHTVTAQGDAKALSRVPGIGKKTAERLLLELRGKFDGIAPASTPKGGTPASDAISALMNLGYGSIDAKKAVDKALQEKGDTAPLPELISFALQTS